MSWEPITYKAPNNKWVEISTSEEGVRLSFWTEGDGKIDHTARTTVFPWDDWEKLISVVEAIRPNE